MNIAAQQQFPVRFSSARLSSVGFSTEFPAKWPFPPPVRRAQTRHADRDACLRDGGKARPAAQAVPHAASELSVKSMVVDVLLVAMWGAMIPGLMWLGAAAGF